MAPVLASDERYLRRQAWEQQQHDKEVDRDLAQEIKKIMEQAREQEEI
jgi:hypothetical protein